MVMIGFFFHFPLAIRGGNRVKREGCSKKQRWEKCK